jgi:hypothetical protein
MGKIFKVTAAQSGHAGKTLQEALLQAKQTGILSVPSGELCLNLPMEIKMEEQTHGQK